MSKKILLLGGNGRVGRYVKDFLEKKFIVKSPSSHDLDITDYSKLNSFISEFKPEVVVNLVMAPISVDDAEKDENKDLVFKINADSSGEVARICQKIDAHLIYFSTAYVFDGQLQTGGYVEEDIKNPLSVYGKSKSKGEDLSLENCSKTTIIRIEMPYSDSLEGPGDILKTFYKMLFEGQTINALDDQYCTPTFIPDITLAVSNLIEKGSLGIWHVAGDKTSPFEMASKIAEIGGFSRTQVLPIKFVDYKRPAPRPQNSCLDSSKYKNEFGVKLHSVDEVIRQFFQNIHEQTKT